MTKKSSGWLLIVLAGTLFLIDRFSSVVSTALAELICKDKFMQPVDGVVGDVSCGFNADMYLALILVLVLFAGFVLLSCAYWKREDG